jgi:DNA-binding transcriptional LysR family regulator
MPTNRSDFADLTYFLAIARHRNFRLAGLELGVSASGLSHALKGLETRLGVRLLNRTNRSVTLTAAGEGLRDAVTDPFGQITQAIEGLNRYRAAPTGRIRLNVVAEAASLLLAPVLPVFIERYPDIELHIAARDQMTDITDGGFDAGIRYGGTVPEDMITQRLSADLRWIVAGAPSYLDRRGTPESPEDLQQHQCLGVRLGDDRIYRWEFEGPDGEFAVTVPDKIVLDDGRAMLSTARLGAGLTYGLKSSFQPYVERGELRYVLEDWSTVGPGYYIYYSSRRQVPTGLKLLIDLVRELRPLGL